MIPWWKVMQPVPWQELHFWGLVPGLALLPLQTLQAHLLRNSIPFIHSIFTLEVPFTDQLKSISHLSDISSEYSSIFALPPLFFPLRPCPPKFPPNKSSKIDQKSCILGCCPLLPLNPLKFLKISQFSNPAQGLSSVDPVLSQYFLLDQSESVSYALHPLIIYLLTSANLSLALGLGFLSGWSSWANLQYAFLIQLCEAFLPTPKISRLSNYLFTIEVLLVFGRHAKGYFEESSASGEHSQQQHFSVNQNYNYPCNRSTHPIQKRFPCLSILWVMEHTMTLLLILRTGIRKVKVKKPVFLVLWFGC